MAEFHFLRPLWLLLLLVVPLLPLLFRFHGSGESGWGRVIPSHLLTPLMSERGRSGGQQRARVWPLALLVAVLSLALAGPAWREAPTPLQQQNDSLVIVLDLSLSMLATDVEPDRLTQAKRKIRDILAARDGSLTALVVYAADAHVVTPLTDDRRTIEGMLGAIDPLIMPATGNRADLGVSRALPLLENGAPARGRVLLITDDVSPRYRTAILRDMEQSDYTLSTLVVGTEEGGPIPLPRHGFIRDKGDIVLARANPQQLQQLAMATGGDSHRLTLNDSDIRQLQLRSEDGDDWQESERDLSVNRWQDDGYWALWAALPLLLLCWRRGALLMVLILVMPTLPRPALALEWEDLWQRPDQRGQELIQRDPEQAASRFDDPDWRGSALYRAGDYDAAAQAFGQSDAIDARYNQANALARSGKLEEALAGYDEVIDRDPQHDDAIANRELVKQLLEQQQQEQQQGQGDNDQNQQSSPQDDDSSQSRNESGEPSDQAGQSQSDNDGDGQTSGNPESRQQASQQQGQGGDQQEQSASQGQQEQQRSADGANGADGEQNSSGQQPAPLAELQGSPLSQGQEQWLRRVPDDPGGLLRRKFLHQYQDRATQPDESDTPW